MTKSVDNLFRLDKKTIVLTGSSGILGSKFAHTLSNAGGNVILIDIEISKNKKLENDLRKKYKTNPKSFEVDFTDETAIRQMVKDVITKYKKIDVLVNNAHFIPRTHPKLNLPLEKFPLEVWDKTINDNLRGLFLCSKEVGKIFLKQKRGTIINISSIYGMVGADQRIYGKSKLNSPPFYAATKGAMLNFTRYTAALWGRKNIRVNTLTLGGVYDKTFHKNKQFVKNYSKKTMLGRMANKEDYDGALLFLASDASSYMTGSNLIVDGGWTAW